MGLAGYFVKTPRPYARSVATLRRRNAEAPSGDVQSGASTASHRERPEWYSAQLSILFGVHRAFTIAVAAAATVSCDASVHSVRPGGPVHRRRRLTPLGLSARRISGWRSRVIFPGAISLWGTGHSGSAAPRTGSKNGGAPSVAAAGA